MLDKALEAVENFNMLEVGDTVIAGVSGGADSMAMLLFLLSIKEEYKLNIIVAHINHGLRGDEADRDENYVSSFCKERDISFKVLHADINSEAKKTGEGTEECGRRVRYEFFDSISKTAKVATAHTASDNAETVLFNLTRGSSVKGICGIPPVRDNIIRPLIYCTREEIEKYCEESGVSFVTDSTNLGTDYTRNKYRHIVIPVLKEINPSFENSVSRLSQSAMLDEACLESMANKLLEDAKRENGFSAKTILSYHRALQQRAVMSLLKDRAPKQADSKRVKMILEIIEFGGKFQLKKNTYAVSDSGIFDIVNILPSSCSEEEWSQEILDLSSFFFKRGNSELKLSKKNRDFLSNTQKVHKEMLDSLIDCDTIKGKVYLSSRRDGDKITLSRRKVTKSLKKLFNEVHIPLNERNEIFTLRDDNGIIWVQGFGVDRKNRVTDSTENMILVDFGGKYNEE